MFRLLDHAYIFVMLFLGIYSQLIMRWQVKLAGTLPTGLEEKFFFVIRLLFSPWVLSSIVATFFAGISWMLAMTKFEISYAYPWVSLSFVLVPLFGIFLFGETVTTTKCVGIFVIIFGIFILAQG